MSSSTEQRHDRAPEGTETNPAYNPNGNQNGRQPSGGSGASHSKGDTANYVGNEDVRFREPGEVESTAAGEGSEQQERGHDDGNDADDASQPNA